MSVVQATDRADRLGRAVDAFLSALPAEARPLTVCDFIRSKTCESHFAVLPRTTPAVPIPPHAAQLKLSPPLAWTGEVTGRQYLLAGVVLFAIKFALDKSLAGLVFDRPWTPIDYVAPAVNIGQITSHNPDRIFYASMMLVALPFAVAGLTLTVRRLRLGRVVAVAAAAVLRPGAERPLLPDPFGTAEPEARANAVGRARSRHPRSIARRAPGAKLRHRRRAAAAVVREVFPGGPAAQRRDIAVLAPCRSPWVW